MYVDLFLKFTDEAEANAVLYSETEPVCRPVMVADEALKAVLDQLPLADAQIDSVTEYKGKSYMADAGQWFELLWSTKGLTPKYAAIDVVGTIYKPTGKMIQTDEGDIPEMAPIPGWHVNVRHNAETPELAAYAVQPKQPTRAWA